MAVKKEANKKAVKPTRNTKDKHPAKRKYRTPPAIKPTVVRAAPQPTPPLQPEPVPEVVETPGDDGLTNKQRVWINQYLICWNATEAARRAGYSDPEVSGWENKQKPAIKAIIDARLKEHKMGADEVLSRLSDMAGGSMGDFIGTYIDPSTNQLADSIDLGVARKAGKLHLIKRLSIGKDGITLEIYDSKSALELLGKHYELFTEKHKHEGEVGTRITNLNDLLKLAYGSKSETKPG